VCGFIALAPEAGSGRDEVSDAVTVLILVVGASQRWLGASIWLSAEANVTNKASARLDDAVQRECNAEDHASAVAIRSSIDSASLRRLQSNPFREIEAKITPCRCNAAASGHCGCGATFCWKS
jgi:hypothetical protein